MYGARPWHTSTGQIHPMFSKNMISQNAIKKHNLYKRVKFVQVLVISKCSFHIELNSVISLGQIEAQTENDTKWQFINICFLVIGKHQPVMQSYSIWMSWGGISEVLSITNLKSIKLINKSNGEMKIRYIDIFIKTFIFVFEGWRICKLLANLKGSFIALMNQ